jgi:hypothetical protein
LLSQPVAQDIENAVLHVFAHEEPVPNFELGGQGSSAEAGKSGRPYTWLVSAYPVRTTQHTVRWAGVIVHVRSREAERSMFAPPRPSGTVIQFFIPDNPQLSEEAGEAVAGNLSRVSNRATFSD